jgi:hypothetical protein
VNSKCCVLFAPIAFEPAADGGWRTVELNAADWVVQQDPPDCPRPWVAFLVVFNTYEQDLGLRVAEFTVSHGSAPPE